MTRIGIGSLSSSNKFCFDELEFWVHHLCFCLYMCVNSVANMHIGIAGVRIRLLFIWSPTLHVYLGMLSSSVSGWTWFVWMDFNNYGWNVP